MSQNIDDGGPAFPCTTENVMVYPPNEQNEKGRIVPILNGGMTLRDYFAAKAMQTSAYQQFAVALVKAMKPDDQRVTLAVAPEVTAREAYRIADAMLAARKEKP